MAFSQKVALTVCGIIQLHPKTTTHFYINISDQNYSLSWTYFAGFLQQADKSTGGVGDSDAKTVHTRPLQVTTLPSPPFQKPKTWLLFSSVLFPPFCRGLPEKVATGVADYNLHYPYYNYCACRYHPQRLPGAVTFFELERLLIVNNNNNNNNNWRN